MSMQKINAFLNSLILPQIKVWVRILGCILALLTAINLKADPGWKARLIHQGTVLLKKRIAQNALNDAQGKSNQNSYLIRLYDKGIDKGDEMFADGEVINQGNHISEKGEKGFQLLSDTEFEDLDKQLKTAHDAPVHGQARFYVIVINDWKVMLKTDLSGYKGSLSLVGLQSYIEESERKQLDLIRKDMSTVPASIVENLKKDPKYSQVYVYLYGQINTYFLSINSSQDQLKLKTFYYACMSGGQTAQARFINSQMKGLKVLYNQYSSNRPHYNSLKENITNFWKGYDASLTQSSTGSLRWSNLDGQRNLLFGFRIWANLGEKVLQI
jgi:hypothetical protein